MRKWAIGSSALAILCGGIALTVGASGCTEPAGMAVVTSMREHPGDWTADTRFYVNEKIGISIWANDLWLLGPPHPFTTFGCRIAIRAAVAPIKETTEQSNRAAMADFINGAR